MNELERVSAIVDCNFLAVRFWDFLDEKNFQGIADMFIEGGIWLRPEGLELSSPGNLLAFLDKRSKTVATCHVVTNIDVKVLSRDRAEATSNITAHKFDDAKAVRKPAPMHGSHRILRAHDYYARTEAGWRVEKKAVIHLFDANLK